MMKQFARVRVCAGEAVVCRESGRAGGVVRKELSLPGVGGEHYLNKVSKIDASKVLLDRTLYCTCIRENLSGNRYA